MFKRIIKYLKQWNEDYAAAQEELNRIGLFTAYHQWGSYIHYTDTVKTTHINTCDDKHSTIPTKD